MNRRARDLIESGDNYWIYRRDPTERVFAVVGAGADPQPYEKRQRTHSYRKIDLDELEGELEGAAHEPRETGKRRQVRLLLYVHGYNNASSTVRRIGDQLAHAVGPDPARPDTSDSLWITYDWPGRAFWTWENWRASKQTFLELLQGVVYWLPVLALLGALFGGIAWLIRPAWASWPSVALVLFAAVVLAALTALRFVAYHRDRYMAMHRGVPDLCEFIRHLEAACKARNLTAQLNFIAHSMGCMLVLNTVRTLSNLFEHDPGLEPNEELTENLTVGRLVLAAPDLPVELLQLSQNNYFYSAMRRFERMYVLANAQDAVLRVLSWLVNSFQEPQPGGDRYRLGNVLFPTSFPSCSHPPTDALCRRVWFRTRLVFPDAAQLRAQAPQARDKIEAALQERAARTAPSELPLQATAALTPTERRALLYGLILERVSFIDGSRLPGMGARLAWVWYPPLRDLVSLVWSSMTHSGYFDDSGVLAQIRSALHGPRPLLPGEEQNQVL